MSDSIAPAAVPASASVAGTPPSWWDRSVGYEAYIRSFADGDGDGVGDFIGLRDRLDHLAWLGVDLLWVTPFYPSPMVDFGYDIADYTGVDPLFGTIEDCTAMIDRAHELGIRVIIDIVPNHTSHQHPWFQNAVASVDADKRDWYVWRDPAPDGGPPNNWISHFGGSAWTLDEASGQYYCHLFLPEQPDLNWSNPGVIEAWKDVLRFWLERGVDGFRIDVTQGFVKDADFRDNTELRPLEPGMSRFEQWDSFVHERDILQDETLEIFRGWHELVAEYDAFLIGETYVLDAMALRHFLEPRDGIHTGFWFEPMHMEWSTEAILDILRAPLDAVGSGIGWVMSSHDDPRAPGRFGGGREGAERALALMTMMMALPGTPFLYQGDELGLADGYVPPERFVDPVSFRTGVDSDNRDGCRTPMPWGSGTSLGFSTSEDPWLPMGGRDVADTVEFQRNDPTSHLHRMRALLAARRSMNAALDAQDGTSDTVEWDAPLAGVTLPAGVVGLRRGPFVALLNSTDGALNIEGLTVELDDVHFRSLAEPGIGSKGADDVGPAESFGLQAREAVLLHRP